MPLWAQNGLGEAAMEVVNHPMPFRSRAVLLQAERPLQPQKDAGLDIVRRSIYLEGAAERRSGYLFIVVTLLTLPSSYSALSADFSDCKLRHTSWDFNACVPARLRSRTSYKFRFLIEMFLGAFLYS